MKKEIVLTRETSAPRERVWAAWTEPAEIKKWWGPNGTTIPEATLDLRVGGDLYIAMLAGPELGPLAGQRWPMSGVFKEIVPNEKIVFENNGLDAEDNVVLTGETIVTLEDDNGKTKLTVTTSGEGDGPNVEQMLAGMPQGWNEQLDKLVKYLG